MAAVGPVGASPVRAGFSLMELLVVLGLIITLTAIGIGAFQNQQRTSRLAGSAALVGDVIRQARHTARMTGQPVFIEIVNANGDAPVGSGPVTSAAIAGVVRVPLLATGFESAGPLATGSVTPDAVAQDFFGSFDAADISGLGSQTRAWFRTAYGRSGQGWQIQGQAVTDRALTWLPMDEGLPSGRRRLMPRPGDGVELRVAVRVPATMSGDIFPLLAVTEPPSDPEVPPRLDLAVAGLALVKRGTPLYAGDRPIQLGAVTTTPVTGADVDIPHVQVVGWVKNPSGTVEVVKATNPGLDHLSAGWHDVSLLLNAPPVSGSSTRQALILINGRLAGSADLPPGLVSADQGTPTVVALGHGAVDNAWRSDMGLVIPPSPGTANILLDGTWLLDDLAITRLGRGEASRLPTGIEPQAPYRLLVLPDGTLRGDQEWKLRGIQAEQRAEVTVKVDGQSVGTSLTTLAMP
jgi:type II secretory pathway pseudopilin PulG